jgi:anti-sigma factor RsiW
MNCGDCQSMLIAFEHDELEPGERAEVATHLGQCSACAVESCRLRADLEGVVAAYAERPDPRVRAALRRKVEQAVRPRWWTGAVRVLQRPVPIYLAAAAGAVPLLLWGLATWAMSTEPPRPTPMPPTIVDYDGATTRAATPHVL